MKHFTFCGEIVTREKISEIKEIVSIFPSLSCNEIANTICELFSWKRPSGKLKSIECRQFLEKLESREILKLPQRRKTSTLGKKRKIILTKRSDPGREISCKLKDLIKLSLKQVTDKDDKTLWREYIERYHYLGYKIPFGAHIQYFIKSGDGINLGCFQFTSPAWKMGPRDQWIDWNSEQRVKNLQKIINNSRFLIFPWVKVKNLASFSLSLAAKRVKKDWKRIYGYDSVLIETLVEPKKFEGTCYKAANWIHVGTTTGYGKNVDRLKRHNMTPKEIFLYPLTPDFKEQLKAIKKC